MSLKVDAPRPDQYREKPRMDAKRRELQSESEKISCGVFNLPFSEAIPTLHVRVFIRVRSRLFAVQLLRCSDKLEISDERVVIRSRGGIHGMAHATQRRVIENVVEHKGAPAPRHRAVLHRPKTSSAELLHQVVMLTHVEIPRENCRLLSRAQLLRHEL